jgi:hypothetical protein
VIANGTIPSSWMGVYFASSQSQRAMELFHFTVAHDVFFGGVWRRRLHAH